MADLFKNIQGILGGAKQSVAAAVQDAGMIECAVRAVEAVHTC
jgi:hypothetical protein